MEILRGCDVSHWDDGFDASKVDVDFIVTKATQGTSYIDPTWQETAEKTVTSGKLLGLYHYLDIDSMGTPEEQADFFYSVVCRYVGEAVLFLDFEEQGLTVDDARRFLDRLWTVSGVKAIVYMSKSLTYSMSWADTCDDYDLWCAWYPPVKSPDYEWAIKQGTVDFYGWPYLALWQFCSDGRLEGYEGNLDLDLFYGSRDAWKRYAARFGEVERISEKIYEDDRIIMTLTYK